MTYQNIQPPFTLKFDEMSKKELKDYNQWFLSSIPERVAILTTAVKSTEGSGEWEPDYSPKSLEALGQWFAKQVETRQRSEEEIQAILGNQKPFKVGVESQTITERTISLSIDIGMYLSEVLRKSHPSLKWDQVLAKKKHVDYGQPVLVGFGSVVFNPVRITRVLARSLLDGGKTGSRLRELYDIWSAKVTTEGN